CLLGQAGAATATRVAGRAGCAVHLCRSRRTWLGPVEPAPGCARHALLQRQLASDLRTPVLLRPVLGPLATQAHLVARHRRAVLPAVAAHRRRALEGNPWLTASALWCHHGDGRGVRRLDGGPLPPRRRPQPHLLRD